MSSSFSEDLKSKIINSGNQLNTVLLKIKESYDRHSEKQNEYFKKYFINCENSKNKIIISFYLNLFKFFSFLYKIRIRQSKLKKNFFSLLSLQ